MIGGLILAAGAGRRFGAAKQLVELDGRPLLEHAVAAMSAVPAIERIVVVVGAHADQVLAGVDLLDAESLRCPGWEEGQAASLRAGLAELAACDAVLITLGDQPRITPQAIARLLDELDSPAPAARAVYGGVPGHPVLVRRELFDPIAGLRGDAGARDLLRAAGAREIECAHLCDPVDVDTPDQLEAIRS